MTLKVLADPSQLNPVSFWPSTVLLSVWMICNNSTHQISPSPIQSQPDEKNQSQPAVKLTLNLATNSQETRVSVLTHLYVDLVICGSVDGTIETKPNHKYPSVDGEPEKEEQR